MRKLTYLFVALLCLGMGSCNQQTKKVPMIGDTLTIDSVADEDTTVYGRCGDGTAMHSLELITADGDTLLLGLDDDAASPVKGGMAVGDRMAVIVKKSSDGEEWDRASLAINLTTLLGRWAALDKSFELQEGGVVVSTITEPHPLTEWKIFNGHLVLSADTFDIYELGADSLYLENAQGIYVYKRIKADDNGQTAK